MASEPAVPGVLTIEQVDAVRRRVLNVVGHELRTPVTALSGLASQLAAADLEEVRTRLGPAIERLANRTEALLDDLLLASGISTALPTDEPARLDVRAALDAAWHAVGDLGADKAFTCEGEGEVVISPAGLERLVNHLVRNAALYGASRITARVWTDGDRVRCEIRNDGPPLHPDELALAFEPFYRGEHAVMTGPGLGLGLPIARMLAEAAGGAVALRADGTEIVAELELPRP